MVISPFWCFVLFLVFFSKFLEFCTVASSGLGPSVMESGGLEGGGRGGMR